MCVCLCVLMCVWQSKHHPRGWLLLLLLLRIACINEANILNLPKPWTPNTLSLSLYLSLPPTPEIAHTRRSKCMLLLLFKCIICYSVSYCCNASLPHLYIAIIWRSIPCGSGYHYFLRFIDFTQLFYLSICVRAKKEMISKTLAKKHNTYNLVLLFCTCVVSFTFAFCVYVGEKKCLAKRPSKREKVSLLYLSNLQSIILTHTNTPIIGDLRKI